MKISGIVLGLLLLIMAANAQATIITPSMGWDYDSQSGTDYRDISGKMLKLNVVDYSEYASTGPSGLIPMADDFTVSVNLENYETFGSSGVANGAVAAGLVVSWNANPGSGGNDYEQFGLYRGYVNDGSTLLDGFAVTHVNEYTGVDTVLAYVPSSAISSSLEIVRTHGDLLFFVDGILIHTQGGATPLTGVHAWLEASTSDQMTVSAKFSGLDMPASLTPIPGAIWLLGAGLVGLVGLRRKIGAH